MQVYYTTMILMKLINDHDIQNMRYRARFITTESRHLTSME